MAHRDPTSFRDPEALPFTVLWTIMESLSFTDAALLRQCSRRWATRVTELSVDIAVESVVDGHRRRRSPWLSPCLLIPHAFRCPYLPKIPALPPRPSDTSDESGGGRGVAVWKSLHSNHGLDGERRFMDIVRAWGRADEPPPNVPGILDSLIPATSEASTSAAAAPVLLVPPASPFGQLLIHWWELSARRSAAASAAAATEADGGQPSRAAPRNAARRRHRRSEDHGVFRLPHAVADDRLRRASVSVRRSRSMADVLRATKPEAPDLAISNSASVAGALQHSMSMSALAASQAHAESVGVSADDNPILRMLAYRAFDESDSDDDAAAAGSPTDAAAAAAVAELKLNKRRELLVDYIAATRCAFVRASPAFERSTSGALAAVAHLAHAVLLPHDKQQRRLALRTSGCTGIVEAPPVGPVDPDFVSVVPFALSYHTLEHLDVVTFALDARPHPILVTGTRIMRGADGRTHTAVRVVASVRGDVDRPQAALSQLARSWFAEARPPSLAAFVSAPAPAACAVTVVDLTGATSGFTALHGDAFSDTLMPSLSELYLPRALMHTLADKCVVDHPRLRRVAAADAAPLVPLYADASRDPASYFQLPAEIALGHASLTTVGADVFRRCHLVERATFPPTLTELGAGCLLRAGGLTAIDLRGCVRLAVIPSEFAGWCPKLTAVGLPPSVDTFAFGAFRGCAALRTIVGLSDLRAPRVEFQRNAFAGAGPRGIRFPPTTLRFSPGAFNACPRLALVDLSGCRVLRDVGARVFTECPRLAHIRLPQGLEGIGTRAFSGCPKLLAVDLSDCAALRTIGDGAFEDSASLQEVAFPGVLCSSSSATGGATNAEDDCDRQDAPAASVWNPLAGAPPTNSRDALEQSRRGTAAAAAAAPSQPQLRTIGARAFASCGALLHADLSALPRLARLGEGAFADCPALIELTLPTHDGIQIGDGVGGNASAQFTVTRKAPPTSEQQRRARATSSTEAARAHRGDTVPATDQGCGGCCAQ